MVDTLLANRSRFIRPEIWDSLQLKEKEYLVMTLHRPANVDEGEKLKRLIDEIVKHSHDLPLVFPVHPRTARIISELNISNPRLHMIEPLGYLEFNYLVEKSKAVITDSGGITEETTMLGVPCMTLRDTRSGPETVSTGTNELLGTNPDAIAPAMNRLFNGEWKTGGIPPLWEIYPTKAESPSILHYTSGTTGQPKGVKHVHYSLISQYLTTKWVLDLQNERYLLVYS